MTQEEINKIVRKICFSGGDPFEASKSLYSLHLKSKINLFGEIIINMRLIGAYNPAGVYELYIKEKMNELESELTKIEKG